MGSTIVAEMIIGLIRQRQDSILLDPAWQPTLGDGFPSDRTQLQLGDIIKFAGLGLVG